MNNLQISSWILKELGCNCERLAQLWDFFLSFFYKIKERIIFKKPQYSSFNLTLLVPLIFFFGENLSPDQYLRQSSNALGQDIILFSLHMA